MKSIYTTFFRVILMVMLSYQLMATNDGADINIITNPGFEAGKQYPMIGNSL